MRRIIIIMIAIILPIFIGSGMIGIALSGDKPEGTPFKALWDAIDYLQGQIDTINIETDGDWGISSDDLYSIPVGNVGIGTETPHKKLEVVGDAMFTNLEPTNSVSNTYFFIEQGRDVNNAGTDGKRIGAYDNDVSVWKTLEVDGGPLLLNARSHQNVTIGGYIQLALTSGPPPPEDCDEQSEHGRMKVDSGSGQLYICVDAGWVTK